MDEWTETDTMIDGQTERQSQMIKWMDDGWVNG